MVMHAAVTVIGAAMVVHATVTVVGIIHWHVFIHVVIQHRIQYGRSGGAYTAAIIRTAGTYGGGASKKAEKKKEKRGHEDNVS
jgi:hypothetical protein